MKLFEINAEINKLLDEMVVDETTGEIIDNSEEIEKLLLEKDEKIKNIALYYLNLCSDAKELKEQEEKFAKRRKAIENRAASLKEYLDYNLSGANKEFTECVLKYSKSKSVEVDSDFVKWAEQNNKTEYLRYKDPEPDKIKLKEVLSKNSAEVPHCHLIEKLNLSIK